MPIVPANGIEINYEVQGDGEPMVLIPYLAADQACYAFQVAEYAKHFACYSVDLRGAGLTSKPDGTYTTELLADDIAAFMQAAGIERAHIFGLSLGAAAGMWLAAKHPERVKSLSLHSAWDRTDPFLRAVVGGWRVMAEGLGSVAEMVIQGIFPWCFTPEMYAARPEYVDSLADFVRSRPMPPVDALRTPVGRGADPRRAGSARRGPGAHAGHLRAARRGDVHPVRGPDQGGHSGQRADRVRGLRARAHLRERRRVQPADPGIPAATLGVTSGTLIPRALAPIVNRSASHSSPAHARHVPHGH